MEEGGGDLSTCWFSLNNSEMKKAVTLVFCSIQYHFIRDIRANFCILNSPQYPYIGQSSDKGIFDFRISCQSLIKVNCQNSRTNDGIDKKLGTVTKLENRNKKNTSFQLIRTSLSFFQFMANLVESENWIPDA